VACALIIAGKSTKKNYLEDFLRELAVAVNVKQLAGRTAAQELAREVAIQICDFTRCLRID